jgi:GMP synthase (glutamine-hydrolysing)
LPRILLVDNYFVREKASELEKSIASHGASVTVIGSAGSSAAKFDEFDGVVLSGSPAMLSAEDSEAPYTGEMDAIRRSTVPVLGICFGHQLMSIAYGSEVLQAPSPTKRYVRTEIVGKDALFSGLPKTISVFESHHEIVETVPKDFVLLARSRTSPVAAMRHGKRPLFGVQFHPERNTPERPHGDVFVGNFVRACGRNARIQHSGRKET